MKHTPGPWTYRHHKNGMWGIFSDNEFNQICRTYTNNKAAEADAYLIAAAPELLSALKALIKALEPFNKDSRLLESINALIVKAERGGL